MKIQLITVGKLKERYLTDAVAEYLKRLKPMANIEIVEVQDEKAPENLSAKMEDQVKLREAERLLQAIRPDRAVIALAIEGKDLSSEELAQKVAAWGLAGRSELVFVIGGSFGLHQSVLDKADLLLSFGRKTFPHQLMRVFLMEQIYRAFKINRGEPYHK